MATSTSLHTAALALHVGLLDADQYRELDAERQAGRDPSALLTSRGWLSADELTHLAALLERCAKLEPYWLEPYVDESGHSTFDAAPPPLPSEAAEMPTLSAARRFRIKQLHATGGIGRVWIAVDETLGRQVALKDLRPELSKPGYQVRFVEEAKITARLEHPGIVPVYELARGEDGQPFYVMRFVKGKTLQDAITRYHEVKQKQPLDFVRLIESFRAICQTVAYAHAQGVLHRDLKPANILLGDFGEVLVLDWGLAKSGGAGDAALAGGASDTHDHRASATQAGQILGTPSYMSPEQAAGQVDAIDARSDVWGLGAILYEILTGEPPFRAGAIDELLRRIKEDRPQTPRSRNRAAPVPLEAVCLKALAKRPEDRYPSAGALADEIQRYLADEPVAARREPLTQRAARWMRRHRTLVTSVSALLITAVIALAVSTVLIGKEYTRAETNLQTSIQEHARAEANLQKALDAVERFYIHISENRLLDEPGMQPLRTELLRDAVRYGEKFAAENKDDAHRQADLARFRLLLGRVLYQSDERARAIESLEQARGLYSALLKQHPQSADYLRGEALVELNLGIVRRKSEPDGARKAYEAALAKFEQLLKKDADSIIDREKLALAHNNLGQLYRLKDQLEPALEQYKLALKGAEMLCAKAPDSRLYQHDRAGFLNNLSDILWAQNKVPAAREMAVKAFEIRQTLARAKVKDLLLDEHLAVSHRSLGIIDYEEKEFEEAERHFRAAVRLRLAVIPRSQRQALAFEHFHLSQALEKRRKLGSALAEMARAIDIQKQVQAEASDDPEAAANLGRMFAEKGNIHARDTDTDGAVAAFNQAASHLEQAHKLKPALVRHDLMKLYRERARAHTSKSDPAAAVLDYDRALPLADGADRQIIENERAAALQKRDGNK